MQGIVARNPYICTRCLRTGLRPRFTQAQAKRRQLSHSSPHHESPQIEGDGEKGEQRAEAKEQGAMSRRLAEMSEESLETGGRSARKAVEEAGFSEDLKRQLEERIASASFRSDNASAFAQAELPSAAGQGTRDIASARPWSGTESVEDASLRMLNDAYKPMKGPSKLPPIRTPVKVDTGRSRNKQSSGSRLANARDKTSLYSFMKDPAMDEKERNKFRKELKDRFTPASRAVPATIQGLASLANERIEDAIARGQFKNLPRGKVIERDYNASSPFLDTTEYFMNKIIQKQDIVPPWIEKQQEVVSTATKFRGRLRADWKRHVARTIASKGGALDGQIRLAEEYAAAEALENPVKPKVEKLNTVDDGGQVSQITFAGELKPATLPNDSDELSRITVTEQAVDASGTPQGPEQQTTISTADGLIAQSSMDSQISAAPPPRRPSVTPFRDESWLATERSYHTLAIENLNSLTRSYNLMAPNLAKKPYFSLARELRSCYADVAPQIANEIRQRALRPKVRIEVIGHKEGGVMERFAGAKVKVYDEVKPRYGLKEFWRDLFQKS